MRYNGAKGGMTMTFADWVILILAVAGVAGGFLFARLRKKQGKTGCSGGCGSCPYSGSCSHAPAKGGAEANRGETCQKPPTEV